MSVVTLHLKNAMALSSTTIVDGGFAVRAALFNHRVEGRGIELTLGTIPRFESNYESLIARAGCIFL
jgi:hypothetical protein